MTNPNIGKRLRLHPATAVWAEFDEEVRPWEGAMQARYSAQQADLDGSGYGAVYETAAANPGPSVAFQSWRGAQSHHVDGGTDASTRRPAPRRCFRPPASRCRNRRSLLYGSGADADAGSASEGGRARTPATAEIGSANDEGWMPGTPASTPRRRAAYLRCAA